MPSLLPQGSADQRLVISLIEQRADLGRLADFHLEQPALAHRVGVDQARFADNRFVYFRYLAGDRRIYIRSRLDRLDHGGGRALFQFLADCRQLDEYEVAELFLSVRGDAHGRGLTFEAEPFMLVGKFQHDVRSSIQVVSRRLYLCSTKGSLLTSTGTRLARTSANIVVPGWDWARA